MPAVPKNLFLAAVAAPIALVTALPASAQQHLPATPVVAPPTPPYADYADLVVAAPVILDALVTSDYRLKPAEAPDVAPGRARLSLEADVVALIRGTGAVPTRIGYSIDVPLDTRGRAPRFRKRRVLLFARPVEGNIAQVQLVAPNAQRLWSVGGEALTRRIVREVLAPDAPPVVTGIGNSFHTAGNLPGEGETRIFLTTADGRPVSLGVTRRSDMPPRWSISLGEVVGDGIAPPPRDTLLWYRLACTLPPILPETATAGAGAEGDIAREDYEVIVRSLGPCDRGGAL